MPDRGIPVARPPARNSSTGSARRRRGPTASTARWDGGGNDTYNLSTYTIDLRLDLRPGASSTFSTDRLAITDTTSGTRAGSNGDTRSLIENAVGGSGNDMIIGNQASNVLTGGAGRDRLTGNGGANIFRDTAAGHDGDTITDLSNSDVIDAVAAVYGLRYSGMSLSFRLAADAAQTYSIGVSGGTFSGNQAQRLDGADGVDLDFDGAPIRFTAGMRIRRSAFRQEACGSALPARGLFLSPGHPVLVGHADGWGGVLVPAMCLINGTSIARVAVDAVTYWHVEPDRHDVLLAEGLPAESRHDMGTQPWFEAEAGDVLSNPDFVPSGESGRCRPVAVDGPAVEAERQRLDGLWAAWLTAQGDWSAADEATWLVA